MVEVKFSDNWDKNDTLGVGTANEREVPNHESSFTKEEMTKLVMTVLDLPDMRAPTEAMDKVFKDMSETLLSDAGKVIVKKGIHQRDTDCHFTMNIYPEVAGGYHVWLVTGADARVPTGPIPDGINKGKVAAVAMFRYSVSGISFIAQGIEKKWPAQFKISKGRMGIGRPRGNSFSVGNSALVQSTPPTLSQRLGGQLFPNPNG